MRRIDGRNGNDCICQRKRCRTGKKLRSRCRNGGNRTGRFTDTRYFQSEDGLTEVEVTVQDEMKDEYQIETAETENGEVTVSISSEASESE